MYVIIVGCDDADGYYNKKYCGGVCVRVCVLQKSCV